MGQKGNKKEIKKQFKTNNNETQHTKTYGMWQGSSKRKIYSDKKIWSKQPNFILKLPEKEQTKPNVNRRR